MGKGRRRGNRKNTGIQRKGSNIELPQQNIPSSQGRVLAASRRTEQFLYSAPIPPPQIVAGWEQVLTGSADRILSLTENQSKHRQGLEDRVVDSNIKNEGRGQLLAFIFCIIVVLSGTFLIYSGKSAEGLVALCAAMVVPAGLFIYAKVQGKQELDSKKAKLTKAQERKQLNSDTNLP